ncbi:hypothetical protein POM88_018442 [Heracleum sosnowskyi]|uniref:Peptidase C1A papain C-terminal domain-containing protein n=1 Tax=Heracleum sosnowskyi TaxID=360622 RepID=A0AAD8IQJ3_9APIA|nr:hypothetical protein POM88_018442 [Heracleum sosnowskyi]
MEVNWVHKSPQQINTLILNQGKCRCCWALAAAACKGFELCLRCFIYTILSSQELIDKALAAAACKGFELCLRCFIYTILSSQELIDKVRLYHHGIYGGGLQDTGYRGNPIDDYQWHNLNGLPRRRVTGFRGDGGAYKIVHGIYYEVPYDTYKDLHVVVVVAMNLKENYFIIRNSKGTPVGQVGISQNLYFSLPDYKPKGEKVSRNMSHERRYQRRSENKEAIDPMQMEASLSLIEIQSLSHQTDKSPITPPVAVEDASKQLGVEIATRSNSVPFQSTEMIPEL